MEITTSDARQRSDALSPGMSSLRDRGGLAADATVAFVRENPWKSLGIAGLLGIAVAVLAARRN